MQELNLPLKSDERPNENRTLTVIHGVTLEPRPRVLTLVVLENHCSLTTPAELTRLLVSKRNGEQGEEEIKDVRAANDTHEQGCWNGILNVSSVDGGVAFYIHSGHGIAIPWKMTADDLDRLLNLLEK